MRLQNRLFGTGLSATKTPARIARRRFHALLGKELLENRCMLNGTPIVVTTVEDSLDPSDGLISLREALIHANENAQPDLIVFEIPGNGPHTIQPTSPLPLLNSGQTTIDATTQAGYVSPRPDDFGSRSIVLSGASLAPGEAALILASKQNVIRGLTINDSPGIGLHLLPGADGNQLIENFIGTDATGSSPIANQSQGIVVESTNNRIERNLISGNGGEGILLAGLDAQSNRIEGNFMGTNGKGDAAVPNASHGLRIASGAGATVVFANLISGNDGSGLIVDAGVVDSLIEGNLIGPAADGTTSLGNLGEGLVLGGSGSELRYNTISGNARNGVVVVASASNSVVYGNRIGLTRDGDQVLRNGFWGVWHAGGADSRIGIPSPNPGDRNIISGNRQGGVAVWGTTSTNTLVQNNYIGTDISGSVDLGNAFSGMIVGFMFDPSDAASGMQVGGSGPFEGNLISGNNNHGIWIRGAANASIFGNIVGLAADGQTSLGNSISGVQVDGSGNLIGGVTPGGGIGGNTISGNVASGIRFSPSASLNSAFFNKVGTDVLGGTAVGNNGEGISIAGNRTLLAFNTVSGNSRNGVVITSNDNQLFGNRIGTNSSGTAALGNAFWGVWHAGGANNRIGLVSSDPGDRNIVSGNRQGGVAVWGTSSSNTLVQNNYIGTDLSGSVDLGNAFSGMIVGFMFDPSDAASGMQVGGSRPFEGNLISGNNDHGIWIRGAAEATILGNIVGLAADGSTPIGNSRSGIQIDATNNQIGGTNLGEPNTVSGNFGSGIRLSPSAADNRVLGNLIGTNTLGSAAAGNRGEGISVSGDRTEIAFNTISGNVLNGVALFNGGDDNTLYGNRIGLEADGPNPISNLRWGVEQTGGARNQIGLPSINPSDRNVISANFGGVHISGVESTQTAVRNNYIGTDPEGVLAIGNFGDGIRISNAARGVLVGSDGAPNASLDEGNLISGNAATGIRLTDAGTSDNIITGNWIGVDSTGVSSLPNQFDGVLLENGASDNRIGGDTASERNVISGNLGDGLQIQRAETRDNIVTGNYLGTDITGTQPLPNAGNGVFITLGSSGNRIGGLRSSGEGNLIAGNQGNGVSINSASPNNVISGNRIGTNASGTSALPNSNGIVVTGGSVANQIGGTVTDEGNLISGNTGSGISISNIGTVQTWIAHNFIGTTADGLSSLGNGAHGIFLNLAASDSLVEKNLISGNELSGVRIGNSSSNKLQGNVVGLNTLGDAPLPNKNEGISVAGSSVGNLIGTDGDGLADSTEGNLISGNIRSGIVVSTASQTTIAGNRIGTDASGLLDLGNGQDGVRIGAGGFDNLIGGATVDARNLISGNGRDGIRLSTVDDNIMLGNWIGVDATGTQALANDGAGITLTPGSDRNRIGGGNAGEGNLISGNQNHGIVLDASSQNIIAGNLIGTDLSGTTDVGNGNDGILVTRDSQNNTIGAYDADSSQDPRGNTISGNAGVGVNLVGAASSGNLVVGNRIGVDLAGNQPIGNSRDGLVILGASDNLVSRNQISGNELTGITVATAGSERNWFTGNRIGTNWNGTQAIPNSVHGIRIADGGQQNIIGTNGDGVNDESEGNLVSGNASYGIELTGPDVELNVVAGNLVGTDATGVFALANGSMGITLERGANQNRIGTNLDGVSDELEGNTVSGNGANGIRLLNFGTDANRFQGNVVGSGLDGSPLPNQWNGFEIDNGPASNVIGFAYGEVVESLGANRIANNLADGVRIIGDGSINNAVRGNSIAANGQLGIDLGSNGVTPNDELDADVGPNLLQNFLVLESAVPDGDNLIVAGSLFSTPSSLFQVDFYASPQPDPSGFGEGRRYLESFDIATIANGASIGEAVLSSPVQPGEWITATVTDVFGNTSEFSNAVPVVQVAASGASTVDEGTTYALTLITDPVGQFPDEWQISWGDGTTETLPGDRLVTSHVYADGPLQAAITVVGVFGDTELTVEQPVDVEVINVAPQLENVSLTELIQEGQFATLSGTIIDPGSADTFTLEVDWGEAIETYALSAGTSIFSVSYFYDDNGLTSAPADTYPVTILSLLDDDGGAAGGEPIRRASIASDGSQANDLSVESSLSADGRFMAFRSFASNLVAGDTNNTSDVFVHDRLAGTTERVSVASDGSQANDFSNEPSLSADGRFVAFASAASNLVAGDTNNTWDIFVHDRLAGTTERISVASDGSQADSFSLGPSISADGRFVTFQSLASNLVTGDTNFTVDVFVHDRLAGTTERISVASDGSQANFSSTQPSISADGRFVAFLSQASNLVTSDTNENLDIFVHDRLAGTTERISVASDGGQANFSSAEPSISADGRFVAFRSFASNLVVGDTNGREDIFVHDRQEGTTERVSVASDGTQSNERSSNASISADGGFVAFWSRASNLVTGDTNDTADIFVHDRLAGTTQRVSVASNGEQSNEISGDSSISADGRFVAFSSSASNLVAGDTNRAVDLFVASTTPLPRSTVTVENVAPEVTIASVASQGLTATITFAADDVSLADTTAGFEFVVDWGDGTSQVIDATPNNGGEITLSHVYTRTDTYQIQLTATDKDSGQGMALASVDVALDPQTIVEDLEAAIAAAIERGTELELDINSTSDLLALLTALGELPPPSEPVGIVLNFNSGIFGGIRIRIPPQLSLFLFNGTFQGASPAITVESGNVILDSLQLTNDTDSPTLLVEGGSVTVRNSRIEESSHFDQTAVMITGGSVELGSSSSPGGNRFDIVGEGRWITNTSASEIPAIGNEFQRDAASVTSGFTIEDGIVHRLDGTGGLVRYEPATLYVTPEVGNVQLAIDAAALGDTVRVQDTRYPGFSLGTSLVTVEFEDGFQFAQELDPLAADQRVVRVQGTDQPDWIGIRSLRGRDPVLDVVGYPNVRVEEPGRIVVYGGMGNDRIGTLGIIDFPVWLYGEEGNDFLRGGRGSDFISGGAGNDILFGGGGRDLLIGGTGADKLFGEFGDDILIAGWTTFDLDSPFTPDWTTADHELAMGSVLAEWRSTRSTQERRSNLSGRGSGPRDNGEFFLLGEGSANDISQTVFHDDQRDLLFGFLGEDWLFFDDDRDRAFGN